MKTLLAALCALPIFLLGSGCDSSVHGNGEFRVETRSVAAFDGVSVGLRIQANVVANATTQSVTISGDSNVLQYIKTRVANGILETKLEGIDNYDSVHRVQLTVAAPSLVSAVAYGDSDMAVSGLEVDAFAASASESSILVVAGADAAERTFLTAAASGNSSIDATAYPVAGASVTLSSGSTAHVAVSGTITCSITGGTLTNSGAGACAP